MLSYFLLQIVFLYLINIFVVNGIVFKTLDTELQNVVPSDKFILIGGTNKLYKLDYDFTVLKDVKTGPEMDNPLCIFKKDGTFFCQRGNKETFPTDNHNKVLLFLDKATLLICGTLKYGKCHLRNVETFQHIKNQVVDDLKSGIASNNASASTVVELLIKDGKKTLLVARTITSSNSISSRALISTRNADLAGELLEVADKKNQIQLATFLHDIPYPYYLIDYKSIFHTSTFIYTTAVQDRSINETYFISKLSRMKHDYTYYIEQQIMCKKNNIQYDLIISTSVVKLNARNADVIKDGKSNDHVMFVLFARSKRHTKYYSDDYAVCYFSLKSIDIKLDENVNNCINKKPLPVAIWLSSDQCSVDAKRARMAPSEIIFGNVLHTTAGIKIGTMLGHAHDRGITLYISVLNEIREYSVTKTGLYEYGKHLAGRQNTLFTKIVLNSKKENLFLLADNLVGKVAINKCENRKTCVDCLSGLVCGWCVLENKCSLKSECKNSNNPNHFTNQSVETCPKLESIQPKVISVQKSNKISFTMANIPQNTDYQCSVGGKVLPVTVDGINYVCDLVEFKSLNLKFRNDGGASVDVSLITKVDKKNVALSTITVFDCNKINNCQKCISGRFTCGWCSKCTEMSSNCDNQPEWIAYQSFNSSSYKVKCPVIDSANVKELASGTKRSIVLSGNRLPQSSTTNVYKCLFKYAGEETMTAASWKSSSSITCETVEISYAVEAKSVNVSIVVMYGNVIIDSTAIRFLSYKCNVERRSCSVCLNAPPEWKCGWCKSSKICTVNTACSARNAWLTERCPQPTIWSFEPKSGSIGGGTYVTIRGSDFGLVPEDIISMTVAGYKCTLLQGMYSTQRLVCKTKLTGEPKSGKINILVNGTGNQILNATSALNFDFLEPSVTNLAPNVGPCSGGTNVTLYGKHLNVGNAIQVYIDDSLCPLLFKNLPRYPNNVTCTTAAILCNQKRRTRRNVRSVKISFDGYHFSALQNVSFTYKVDPTLTDVFTNKMLIRINTFASGGQVIRVEGQRLNIIQKPMMTFRIPALNMLKKSPCKYSPQNQEMVCLTPNVSSALMGREKIPVVLGFEMDNVVNVREFKNITVLRDPVFSPFSGDNNILVVKTNDLILTGSGISVLSKGDVKVHIGDLFCAVTDVDERLVCTIPKENEMKPTTSDGLYPVKVSIGEGGLSYDLGFIQFYKSTDDEVSWVLYLAPPVAGVVILIIIIVVLVIIYQRKHKKDKESHELALIQIDQRECQVARECKEAFADYQTGMIDLTQEVDRSVAPYHQFRDYAMHVLCPGLKTHPIIEKNRDERDEWEDAMKSMVKLMKNKDFLLTFIRTLEAQSSFQMTDRCVVASLLMAALQDDVRYITDILKELLGDLINKTGTGKRPKLLLRRTESVAEKLLTNWLAYTLHPFLESHVGEPLFKLFAAIDIFLDKEPVDSITFDARNSLSEDKLLRQKIDYKNLSITVEYIHDDKNETFEGIPVLSSDTISQTRAKVLQHIYKNKPFSTWPSPDDLMLGFVSANGAILVLQDEDSTNSIKGEWKHVNTLEHYKVQDGSSLRLAGPQIMVQNFSSAIVQEPSVPSIAFQPDHASTPMLANHQGNEPKLWHMVKVTDYPVEQKEDVRHSKMMAEVYLTRLLKTKETLQSFVDTLFDSIFGLHEGGRVIPPCVKYLFDFLDAEAIDLNILDWEVHHTWKNNSLPLRFWINMIKNPDFIFDIKKSNTVDSCLSVIAQLFMDSCSPDDHRLGKDSPSNKLLYAKEIPDYKKKVKRFYMDVKETTFDEQAFEDSLDEMSKKFGATFNSCNAASELMSYAVKYKVKVMDNLEDNDFPEHAEKLQEIMENIPDD
ncbi:plexin-A4-like isoform X2 [Hydractinia symbiolongicarpus]|uniref:plexin-A4-like isoform X2 n=1 Tax=Hydractinia symbiolongicarpus TaxID=13093 RepID=UPI002549C791|nr:plexin-A4-like isoform X2 [Hydractinia symbiolongicarpus]